MNAALDDRHLLSTVATSTRNRRKKNKKHIGLSGQSIGQNPDVAHFSKNRRQEGHVNFIENIVAILCNTCTCKQDDERLLQKNSFTTLPPNDNFKTEKRSLHASTHSPHTQVSKKNIYIAAFRLSNLFFIVVKCIREAEVLETNKINF